MKCAETDLKPTKQVTYTVGHLSNALSHGSGWLSLSVFMLIFMQVGMFICQLLSEKTKERLILMYA